MNGPLPAGHLSENPGVFLSLFLFVFIALFDLTPFVLARDESKGMPIQGTINSQDAFGGLCRPVAEIAGPATGSNPRWRDLVSREARRPRARACGMLVVAGGSAAFLAARSPQNAGSRRPRASRHRSPPIRFTARGQMKSLSRPPWLRKWASRSSPSPSVRPLQISPLQGVLAVDSEHLSPCGRGSLGKSSPLVPSNRLTAQPVCSCQHRELAMRFVRATSWPWF